MLKKKSGGFTLIEITIVMAITATLAAMILAGQSVVRAQSEFNSTVNNAVAKIQAVRNATVTGDLTINSDAVTYSNEQPSAGQTDNAIYAKLITAIPGKNYITVTDVVGHLDGANTQTSVQCTGEAGGVVWANAEILTVTNTNTYQIPLNWGVTVGPAGAIAATGTVQIAFHRTVCQGLLTVSSLGATGHPTSWRSYTENPAASASPSITLIGVGGRTAIITVNGIQNGAVTVTYP